MKRIVSLIAVRAILVTALVSCDFFSGFGKVAEKGDVTVVVETSNGAYEVYKTYLENVENKSEGVKGVLDNLCVRSTNALRVVMDDTAFVTEIGSIKQNVGTGSYVMIYTSFEKDSYAGAPTVEYEGVTLYQSGFGIKDMTVESGTVILFRLETYG